MKPMNGFCLRCDIPYCGGTCPGCTVEKAQTLPPVWTRALSVLSDSSAPSVSAITERLSVGDLRVIFPGVSRSDRRKDKRIKG